MQKMIFIIVNYNNSTYTLHLCESLKNQIGFGIEFDLSCLVVNNSTDINDTQILHDYCKKHSWISVLDSPDNPGYFGGLNKGLVALGNNSRGWVVIGNNDLEFDVHFVQTLFRNRYDSSVFVICPDVITKDGIHQNPHVAKRIGFLRRLKYDIFYSHYFVACILKWAQVLFSRKKNSNNGKPEGEIHMGIGACYVLTPSFFQFHDALNYPLFLYGEEAFLSQQVHESGGSLWFDPSLKALHAESATLNRVPKRTIYEYNRKGYPLYRRLL